MKLNLYTFTSLMGTNNAETSMFAMIVATKLNKSFERIEKSVEKKNPRTLSALLGFSLNCYDEFMANLHPDIDSTDSRYMAIFADYSGKVRSLCNWENKKSDISVLNSILTIREKKANTETQNSEKKETAKKGNAKKSTTKNIDAVMSTPQRKN